MTTGTCLNIRPANSVTRVQQSRFPKFVNDIFSAFGTFSRVRCVCGPCAVLVRSCAVLSLRHNKKIFLHQVAL
jgi:hypothetical protein